MDKKYRKLPSVLLGLSLSLSAACQDSGELSANDAELLNGADVLSKPIRYGQLTPTLYTELTSSQQDSIVAICHRNRDRCFCTGTLLSPHVILTAAHCFIGDENDHENHGDYRADHVEIRVGQDNRSAVNNKRYRVAEIFNYQREDGSYWFNTPVGTPPNDYYINDFTIDRSLVILRDGIYDSTPFAIYNGSLENLPPKTQMQNVGYGCTEEENDKLGCLNRTKYWTTMELLSANQGEMIRLLGQNTGTGKGDSGSPLLYKVDCEVKVVGVLSTGSDTASNYNPVRGYADWITDKIQTYDPPECAEACSGFSCGQVGTCTCGGCERGYVCNNEHQCELVVPGNGGFCFNNNPIREFPHCDSNTDCPTDHFCWKDGARCVKSCKPQNCLPGDPTSWCLPSYVYDYGTAMNMCIISNLQPCPPEMKLDTPCYDSVNDVYGVCFNIDGKADNLSCYPVCDNVATCQYDEACYPADNCSAVCADGRCGDYSGCDCGNCTEGFTCKDGYCVVRENQPADEQTDTDISDNTDEQTDTDNTDTPENTDEQDDTDRQDNSDELGYNDNRSDTENGKGTKNGKRGCNGGGESPFGILLALGILIIHRKYSKISL